MKRILKKFGCLLFCLVLLVPSFFCAIKQNISQKVYANFEENLHNIEDLISINPTAYSNAIIEQNSTPFDEKISTLMPGAIVTPNADNYAQIKNQDFYFDQNRKFSPKQEQSVYMWIYLIDTDLLNFFQLKLYISDGVSNYCEWVFESDVLFEWGSGWKLVELNFDDCSKTFEEDVTNIEFSRLSIKYYSELEDLGGQEPYQVINSDRLSFYHVFLADSYYSETSGIVEELHYGYGGFKESFLNNTKLFVGDSYTFTSAEDVFKYVYFGKYPMTNSVFNDKYKWKIKVNLSGIEYNLSFGDKMTCSKSGYYNIVFELYEKKSDNCVTQFSRSVFCDELSPGYFLTGPKCWIKERDSKVIVQYKISKDVAFEDDISFAVDNNNVEIDSYYKENGVYYITLAASKNGTTNLIASAKIKSPNGTTFSNEESTIVIQVDLPEDGPDIFIVILWIAFVIFCLFIVVYMIISVVKSKRNDVK